MIKKSISYFDIIDGEEIELEETVRFCFTLAAMRLYQQKTGRFFFTDFEKVSNVFTSKIQAVNLQDINNLSVNEQLTLFPILVDPVINSFLLDCASCFYTEVIDGRYIQNEETISNAETSLWFMNVINIEFFTQLLQEVTMHQPKDHSKSKKK